MTIIAREQEDGLYRFYIENEKRYIPGSYTGLDDTSNINARYHDAITNATVEAYEYDHESAQNLKVGEIDAISKAMILQGFSHERDGTTYYFRMEEDDQLNWLGFKSDYSDGKDLTGVVMLASGVQYTFASNADFLEVYAKGFDYKKYVTYTGGGLKDQAMAATTREELEAVQDTPAARDAIWAVITG